MIRDISLVVISLLVGLFLLIPISVWLLAHTFHGLITIWKFVYFSMDWLFGWLA